MPAISPVVDRSRPSLRDRKKDATRHAIEDVAWELFSEQGYDATTVQQIADQANVAPRTFFRYFPSKEAVLYPELDARLAELAAAFAARPADEPALVSLVAAMDVVWTDFAQTRARQYQRFEMLKKTSAAASGSFVNDRVVAAVTDMVRRRRPGDPEAELQAQIAGGILGVVMTISTDRWLARGGEDDIHDEAKHCFGVLQGLVGAPGTPRAGGAA